MKRIQSLCVLLLMFAVVHCTTTAPESHLNTLPSSPEFYMSMHGGSNGGNTVWSCSIETDSVPCIELIPDNSGGLDEPRGIIVSGGYVYVVNANQTVSSVLRFDATTLAPSTFATGGDMLHPYQAAFGPDGNLYVSSQDVNIVSRFDPSGVPVPVASGTAGVFIPNGEGGLNTPRGMVWGPDGKLYVASRDTDSIIRYDSSGNFVDNFVSSGSGGLQKPIQLIFSPDGQNLYVGSSGSNQVLQYNGTTGSFVGVLIDADKDSNCNLVHPAGLAFSPAGDLYVISQNNNVPSTLMKVNVASKVCDTMTFSLSPNITDAAAEFIVFLQN